jgi:hypothetical protein
MATKLALVIASALLLAACGSDDDGAATTVTNDDVSLSITAPTDGSAVDVPFTVEFGSSEELGLIDDGLHHVHVFWDGAADDFDIVEGSSAEITDAPKGEHTLNASLHSADHTPAGVELEITLDVGGESGGDSDDGGGPGY